MLRGAELAPADVDITSDVKAAAELDQDGLRWLLATLKPKLRHAARRAALVAGGRSRQLQQG